MRVSFQEFSIIFHSELVVKWVPLPVLIVSKKPALKILPTHMKNFGDDSKVFGKIPYLNSEEKSLPGDTSYSREKPFIQEQRLIYSDRAIFRM